MIMKNEVILPDIEYGSRKPINLEAIDLTLTTDEKTILKLAENTFTSGKKGALAVVKTDDAFKIVRTRKAYIFQTLKDAEFSRVLSDYNAYLDFLFMNDIETAYITDTTKAAVELMLKSLVSYYDFNIGQERDGRVVRIYSGGYGETFDYSMFFRPEDIRSSFNADFLKKIQSIMRDDTPSENSKNRIGIEHIAQSLKNTPRPKMRVLESDSYIK